MFSEGLSVWDTRCDLRLGARYGMMNMAKKSFGFSSLYNDLINELTLSWLWKFAGPGILIICGLSVSISLGRLTAVDRALLAKFMDLAIALLMFFIVLGILFGVIFGVMANLSGVNYRPTTLTARIVIASQHPFNNDVGLSYDDLQHLKVIGQVEQSAAGWQGGLLSFAVIWFLAENIGLFTSQADALISAAKKAQNIHNFGFDSFGWSIFWLFILIFIGAIAFIIFKFIYGFLGHEPANRAIIKACEDGQAILETLELKDEKKLTIQDKQRIAELCECAYMSQNKMQKDKFRRFFVTREAKNKDFILITSSPLRTGYLRSQKPKKKQI